MITKEDYLDALKEIKRLEDIVKIYHEQNNPYKSLTINDLVVKKDVEMHPLSSKYLSICINDNEVQRITEVYQGEQKYKIFGGKYFDEKDNIIKKTANWFKRKGMNVSIKDFREFLEPYFEYFEKN